jgi:hypothetical protein
MALMINDRAIFIPLMPMNKRSLFFNLSLLVVFFALLAIAACKKDKNSNYTVNYMYNYYPIDSGHSITYNVDSVNFTYDGINYYRDTTAYQMQAIFGDTIHDLLDSVNFRIFYSTRANSSSAWGSQYGTYGLRTLTNLQVIENDLRFIKLTFPPQLNGTWNGNLYIGTDPNDPSDPYNIFAGWNYYYENCDTTITIGPQTYNNCIIVSEVNNVNVISKTVRTEIYAPAVGMIYQEWIAINNQNSNNIMLGWDTGATQGYSIHMWAIAHNP